MRKEEVRKKLERELAQTEARIKNWESVERKHKKDGGDFANIWKNFDKLHEGYTFSGSGDVEVKIYGSYPDYSLAEDFIYVKNENFTPDGIEEAVKNRIEYLKQHKEIIRDNLGIMDNLYDETMDAMAEIYTRVEEVAGNRTPLYYIMREAIEDYFHPIKCD